MPYPYGTKGAQGGRQIAPGLPVPACMSLIDNTNITSVSSIAAYRPPLNANFDPTLSDWECFSASNANSISTAASVANTSSRSLYLSNITNGSGFPISDTEFITITCESTNNKLYASVFNIAQPQAPSMTGDYLLAANSGSATYASLYPAQTPRLFLAITKAAYNNAAIAASVFYVNQSGQITTASIGTVTGGLPNYGDDNTGIYIKAVPLGIFGGFEHWLCTSGVGNTNTLISFEIATGNITYTQLALYLGVVTVFNKTANNIQVSGYAHPAQWGAYCTTAPHHSYGRKSTFVINFNALTGAYISTSSRLKADSGLETGDGISAHGAYPYYISQGCMFGNTPELLVSLSNSNGDNKTYECNETPQAYWSSQISSLVMAYAAISDGLTHKSIYSDKQYFCTQNTINLPNKAVAMLSYSSYYNQTVQSTHLEVISFNSKLGEFNSPSRIAAPSGFDISTAFSNKIIALKDRVVWLNKTQNNTTAPIKLCYVYPK
jgi:hypothetical protein